MSRLTLTDRACGGIKAKKLLDAVRAGTNARISASGDVYFSKPPVRGREWRAFPPAFLSNSIEISATDFQRRAAEIFGIEPERTIELQDQEIVFVARSIAGSEAVCVP